ncbi:uncharacterized protein PpBr36_09323 [Pyricularia pennisetigena]|uniref:uncharacterized protein n=1 Tax=Pyricularia pennisetigena TaxID=1578925 RepID=UPI0011503281|nr:uncharacterized protein PpBr36_09323 [Pyricularia pennisetigena]TLS21842.1 hypothetical protein PpBr36_09323 [Pyricularia pennisetigena]
MESCKCACKPILMPGIQIEAGHSQIPGQAFVVEWEGHQAGQGIFADRPNTARGYPDKLSQMTRAAAHNYSPEVR